VEEADVRDSFRETLPCALLKGSRITSAFERPRDQRGVPVILSARAFFLGMESRLPKDAWVLITIADPPLCFFGTYLLYPREVLVSDPGIVLNNEAVHSLRPSVGWLRAHRIDAVVAYSRSGEQIPVILRDGRWERPLSRRFCC
jgi:hypothetical protein